MQHGLNMNQKKVCLKQGKLKIALAFLYKDSTLTISSWKISFSQTCESDFVLSKTDKEKLCLN